MGTMFENNESLDPVMAAKVQKEEYIASKQTNKQKACVWETEGKPRRELWGRT